MSKILLTNFYNPGPLDLVKRLVPPGFELIALEKSGKEEVIRKAADADYLLVGGRTKIDQKVLDAALNLKMIQRSGVGLDSLDLNAIHERGIPLYVNEGINARSVAEQTLMLILGTLRKIAIVDARTRNGEWVKHDIGITCHDLYGKQVGLIGLGNIGMHVVRMLKVFGVDIVYCKKSRLSFEQEESLGVRQLTLKDLLATSDIISLHCSLNKETKGLLGFEELAEVKRGAFLINTARGGLVNESALLKALETGCLAGAGLDVFEKEPLPEDHPFFKQSNVLLTPHIGSITAETFSGMIGRALQNIALFDAKKTTQMTAKRIL
jgi:D-3-phosphoglycerate dehydrogenase / 2-oxoglutarate reductase